jgi:hypothetical protein
MSFGEIQDRYEGVNYAPHYETPEKKIESLPQMEVSNIKETEPDKYTGTLFAYFGEDYFAECGFEYDRNSEKPLKLVCLEDEDTLSDIPYEDERLNSIRTQVEEEIKSWVDCYVANQYWYNDKQR